MLLAVLAVFRIITAGVCYSILNSRYFRAGRKYLTFLDFGHFDRFSFILVDFGESECPWGTFPRYESRRKYHGMIHDSIIYDNEYLVNTKISFRF